MSKETYCQCKLQKGVRHQISYIPSRYAIIGKYLELDMGGTWENGWQVISCGKPVDGDYIKDRNQDYKITRKASDI